MAGIDQLSAREEFEELVEDSAPRPRTAQALLPQLDGQLGYQEEQSREP